MCSKIGILYALRNKHWQTLKKCGRTSQKINKRISNLQTSLIENCEIVDTTDELVDTYFYEYLLKQILSKYRVRNDREFYDVGDEEVKDIFICFNEINAIFNTTEKLNNYIMKYHPNYIKYKKPKNNKHILFVDTRY